MSTAVTDVLPFEPSTPHPAAAPPPLLPWNGFDLDAENGTAWAVTLLAEILMDDEWHRVDDVVDELMDECGLTKTHARFVLKYVRSHGDLRRDDRGWIRLTTRWQDWQPEQVQP